MVSSTRSDVAGIGESDALNAGLSGDERRTLARALDFAASVYGEKPLGTGEPAYGHAIGLARNVAELRLDADARVAGLLFSVPEYLSDGEEKLAASFGAAVASLVAGISRLNSLRMITRTVAMGKDSQSQAEVLRKMLLAIVEDIRVVLLRLASRTQTLRWLSRGPEAGRRELAREDRKSTRLNSSHVRISYAVFCLKKKTEYDTTPWRLVGELGDSAPAVRVDAD